MPKELAKVSADFADIQKRIGPMLADLERLNNNYWNETAGTWGRYYAGLDMLAERLQKLGAASATDPKASGDAEVATLLKGIASAKSDSFTISKDYWNRAKQVAAITREMGTLHGQILAVIKQKSGILSRSNSVPALQQLAKTVDNYKAEVTVMLQTTGPQKPDSKVYS